MKINLLQVNFEINFKSVSLLHIAAPFIWKLNNRNIKGVVSVLDPYYSIIVTPTLNHSYFKIFVAIAFYINLVKEIIRVLNTKRRDSYRIKVLIFIYSFGKKNIQLPVSRLPRSSGIAFYNITIHPPSAYGKLLLRLLDRPFLSLCNK